LFLHIEDTGERGLDAHAPTHSSSRAGSATRPVT
jgi:hypothetical protein